MKGSRAVVFDVGNVLVHWDPRFLYEKLIHDPEELDFFLNDVVTLTWHTEHDRGRSFRDGIAERIQQFPEYEDLITAYDTRWYETISDVIEGSVQCMEQLAENGICVYGLTNFSAEKWPGFCRLYEFTDIFHGVVVSGEEKLVKPDPRIFQILLERFDLDPEATLYIDDRRENVEAAKQLDMHGHVFTSPERLKQQLSILRLI